MRERDTAWIYIAAEHRPCVVIESREGYSRVAYGTQQERTDYQHVVVSPDSRQGRAFPLDRVTYFYGANTEWRPVADLRPGARPCSFELLHELRRIVDDYDASLEPARR
jgi:hypothetical protein